MSVFSTRRHAEAARRVARLLRPAAAVCDAWVSTEAAVELPPGPPARPAVVVVQGELPPDGVVRVSPLLIVELDARLAVRWQDRCAAVWAPSGTGAVAITRSGARHLDRSETLAVAGHPPLRLAVDQLLGRPVAEVASLTR